MNNEVLNKCMVKSYSVEVELLSKWPEKGNKFRVFFNAKILLMIKKGKKPTNNFNDESKYI